MRNGEKRQGDRAGVLIQFVKYSVVGSVATSVGILVFYTLGSTVWPCLTENDFVRQLLALPVAEGLSDSTRSWRAVYCNTVAFVISNGIAYLGNVLFVFRRGRHAWPVEIGLFYLVSGVAAGIGTLTMKFLIGSVGLTTTVAYNANLVAALSINYAMRRFVIFKG